MIGQAMAITPKNLLLFFVASLVAAGLVVVAMGVMGEYTKTMGRLLATALCLSGLSLLALPPSGLTQGSNRRAWGYAGLGICGVAYLLVAGGIWGTPDSDAFWKAAGIASIGAASQSQICWLLMMKPNNPTAKAAWSTSIAASALVPVVAGIGIIAEIKSSEFWWAVALMIIFQVLSGLSALFLNRWLSRTRAPSI
jgi:hypothetical protein